MLASPEQWLKAVKSVVSGVKYPGYNFVVAIEYGEAVTVRVSYDAIISSESGGVTSHQTMIGRPWVIEFGCHPIQIVQTCFLALLTSIEHRTRESFTWQGMPIMHPHRTEQEAVEITQRYLMRRRGHEEHVGVPTGKGEEKT
jgi:hypothetical protein